MTKKTLDMPFWDHLEELRWRLIKSILTIIIGACITYNFSDAIMHWFIIPTESLSIDLNLQVLKITSMFTVKLSVALFGGIILGLPIIFYQFWLKKDIIYTRIVFFSRNNFQFHFEKTVIHWLKKAQIFIISNGSD